MKIAKVIGRMTLSRKDISLEGARFVILSPLAKEQLKGDDKSALSKKVNLVAFDPLGAAQGDIVGYTDGAEASAPFTEPTPVDAYVVALFDTINYRPDVK